MGRARASLPERIYRSDPECHPFDQNEPEFPAHHRQRLERGGHRQDGLAAVPRVLSILRVPGDGWIASFISVPPMWRASSANIASYALLLAMMAQECDLTPGIFVHTFGGRAYLFEPCGWIKRTTQKNSPNHSHRGYGSSESRFSEIRCEDIQLVGYEHDAFITFLSPYDAFLALSLPWTENRGLAGKGNSPGI